MDMPDEEPPEYADIASEESEEEEEEEEEFDEEAHLEAQRSALEQQQLSEALDYIEQLVCLPDKSTLNFTAHHRSLATSFLKESKEILLCCYILRTGGRVRIALSLNLPLWSVGVVWYFLKMDTEEKITIANFKRCVSYGTVETDDPHAIQHFLLDVYQPVVASTSVVPHIRNHHYALTGISRAMNLVGAQLVHHVGEALGTPRLFLPREVLALPDDLEQIKKLPLDVDFLCRLEELVLHWVEQIQVFTFEQGDASSPLELGLLHEIRQLATKGEMLGAMMMVIESSGVKKVLTYLEAHSSPLLMVLENAINNLKVVQNRLRETGGQLVHLEPSLEYLYTDSVQALPEHMYDVLVLLRIIWTHSSHYHKTEVMTELCVRVSWEVTRACQVHLPLDSLFSPILPVKGKDAGESKQSFALVETTIKGCTDWRNCYLELATHFGELDAPEVWLPNTDSVFLPVELFASRCEDLKYIGLSKLQLTRHGEGGVMSVKATGAGEGGAEGELLEDELSQVDRVLDDALKAISRKSHLVFNLTSKEWLKHFDRFRESMEEVERRYQCVMVAAVQTVETVAQGLRVLNVFKPLAARKALFNVFYVMIDHILNLFDRDFEDVEKEYVFRSMKVGSDGFYFSKMARWATDTRKKLEQEVNLLKNQSWLPYYPRLDSIYERWGRTVVLLRGVVCNMYAAWNASQEPQPSRRLMEPIFRWRPGPVQNLQDNFDMQLYKNLEEAAAWKGMGYDVPESLHHIFLENEQYMKLKSMVSECTEDFNTLIMRLSPDEAQMFEAQVQLAIKTFYPGLSIVSWQQKQHNTILLTKCHSVVKSIQGQVTQYLSVNEDISSVLMEAKELVLYTNDGEGVYVDDEFYHDLIDQCDHTLTQIKSAFCKMEEMLDTLHSSIIIKTYNNAQNAWVEYVLRVDNLFLDCEKEILRKSLLTFEGMLMGSRSCPTDQLPPVFKLSVRLIDNKIVCKPSVNKLVTVVSSLQTMFTGKLKKVPCLLRRFALEKSKAHEHLPLLKDELSDKLQNKLTEEFQSQVKMLTAKVEQWQRYRDLWEIKQEDFFHHYLQTARTVDIFESDIKSFESKLHEIEGSDDDMKVATFYINCKPLKAQLADLCKSWISEFESKLFKIASDRLDFLYRFGKKTSTLLQTNPKDITSLLDTAQNCRKAKKQLTLYRKQFKPIREQFEVLQKYHYAIPKEVDDRLDQLGSAWDAAEAALINKALEVNTALDGFRKKNSDSSELVIEEVESLKQNFRKVLPTRLDKTIPEAKESIKKLNDLITDITKKLDINENLMQLSLSMIEFPELPSFQHDLVAAEKMWNLLSEWQNSWDIWSKIIVWEVSVVALQETLTTFGQKIRGIHPFAADKEGQWEIKEEILSRIELCKLLVPLTSNLQNANLRSHHWQQIKSLVKTNFDKDSETFTLGYLQKLNLTSYEKELAAIMLDSSEETKIVNEINDIQDHASNIVVNMKPIASMGISVVQSTGEAYCTIGELNMRLQVLSASHHAKPYLGDIEDIRKMLSSMIEFLENVEGLQKEWSTWEPFFYVMDVRYHLVHATAVFDSLNDRWRQLSMNMTADNFLKTIALQEHLKEEVVSISTGLREIPRYVKPYLHDRKEKFSRFWLMTNDDLVAALSTAIDGERAKPYLPMLFSNIDKIKQERNSQLGGMEIIGVYSKEGEFLELTSYVPIQGTFDMWLRNLINAIESTLKDNIKQCRNSMKFAGVRIDEVVKLWPLQVNIVAYMLHFTAEVQRALAKFKGNMSAEQMQGFKKRIKDTLLRLDGYLQGNVAKLMREKTRLFYLLILQIRDFLSAIAETRKGFATEADMPIRYTWDKDSDKFQVHFGGYDLMYSWEYQGLWSFNVFTPSTLASMASIARVLSLGKAVGVLGPHSSGKTETVKTLTHLLGRHLVTVTCTPSVTSVDLAHTLLGTCSSHSWLLLENVHNLNPDVVPAFGEMLQVVHNAQQTVPGVKTGKSSKLQQQPVKLLEGVPVTVSPLAMVLLEIESSHPNCKTTMDTLRTLCRPVVMYAPELQLVTEALLLVEGFKEFRSLSQKLSHAFASLRSSLPMRNQYQLGLRSIAAVVALAKDVTKRQPEVDEIDTIPLALTEYLMPQLREKDVVIFHDIFDLLFPDFDAAPYTHDVLRDAITAEMKDSKLFIKDSSVDKIIHLHEAISRNQKLLVFGHSGSGKSTSLHILERTYNRLNYEGVANYKAIKMEVLNPLVVGETSLYGPDEDMVTKVNEGYLPHAIRKYHKSNPGIENWIVLEGPHGHSWLQELFLHMHLTNNVFLSGSRQQITFPNSLKLILEISGSISNLSPSQITFFYTVFFPSQPNLWEDVIQSWVSTLTNPRIARALQTLLKKNLPNFINNLNPETVAKPQMIMKAKAFVAIMNSFMKTEFVDCDPEDWVAKLAPAFIFSVIWSFGANISTSEAAEFKEVVTRMIEDVPEGSIYDYYVDANTGSFASWKKFAQDLEDLQLDNPLLKSKIAITDRVIKYTNVSKILMSQGIPVLLKGSPGTGKSAILSILKQTSPTDTDAFVVTYTAATRAEDIQNTIESNLMKQDKNVLASKKAKLHLLIDDLDCSNGYEQLDEILATIRYTSRHRKIYSYHSKLFFKIPELCYFFAFQIKDSHFGQETMQETNNHVNSHWPEAFHMLTLPPCEDEELEGIFSNIFDKNLGHFEQEVKCLKSVVAEGLIHLYRRMGQLAQVKHKAHLSLIHHPRQIVALLKGLQMGDEETQDRDNFLKHLTHECYRVFQDATVIPQDEFNSLMNEVLSEYLCINLDSICKDPENFLLSRLGNIEDLYTYTRIEVLYPILKDAGEALFTHSGIFALYNSLFHHTVRLLRIMGSKRNTKKRDPAMDSSTKALESVGGHIVLVGPEGCGKKTCARIVASIIGCKIYEVYGIAKEAEEKCESILQDLADGKSVLVIIDWNIIENIEYLAFLSKLLVDRLNAESISDKNMVKILLSVPTPKEAHEILRYIPAVTNFYSVDNFHEWSLAELQDIAKQILTERLGDSLSNVKAQPIAEIISFIHNHVSNTDWVPSSRFLDFIKLFLQIHDKLLTDIIQEKEKLQMSIVKFEDTQKRVAELSSQLQEQRAQVTYIQQSCGSIVLKMRNIKSEQGRLEQDLNKNAALLKRQKDESLRIKELINRDLTAPKLEMKSIHRKLDRITRAELETLKGLGRPPSCVELVFDAVLTTLGLDPSWNEAKKQIVNGLDFISAIRKIPVEGTDEKTLLRIQNYLKLEELNADNVAKESPTAATFLNWLQAFEKYVRVYKDYHPLKIQADIITRDIEATEQTIAQYEEDLTGFGMEHKVLMAQLKEKEQQLEAAEEEMKVLESRIQLAQKVMTQLGQDKIHWEEALSHCSVKLRNIFGDAVLAAAYVTYIGCFTYNEKESVMNDWLKKMEKLCIFHTEERNVQDILAPLDSQVRWHEKGLPIDSYSLKSASIIANSSLPQLILDPHSLLEKWILNGDNAVPIDLDDEDYMSVLQKSMQNGDTCVIVQEKLSLPLQVLQILEMERVQRPSKKGKVFLKVGDNQYEIHSNFKIIMIVKDQDVSIKNKIKTVVNVVNLQSQQEGITELLTSYVAIHCQPDLIETLKKCEWDLLEKQTQLSEQEATIRNLMSRFDDDVLEENTLMEMLQAACAKAADAKRKCNDLKKALDAAKETNQTYKKIANLITRLYMLVEKLPRVHQSLTMEINRFSEVVMNELQPQSLATSWNRLLSFNTVIKMLQTMFRYFQDQVSDIVLTTVGLILATWYEQHIGLVTPAFCSLLYTSVSQGVTQLVTPEDRPKLITRSSSSEVLPTNTDSLVASRPKWLTNAQWVHLMNLSKIEPFTELIESLITYEEMWRVWYMIEQPETVSLPKKLEKKVRGVAKLILINCLRPDRFDEASALYVEHVLKQQASPTTAKALLGVAGRGNAAEPVILYSSAPLDVEHLLKQILPLCHPIMTSDPEAINVLALGQGREEYLKLLLQRSMQKGYWVVLKKDTEAESCVDVLMNQMNENNAKEVNKRFQAWLYLHEDDELPDTLMSSCHKVYLSLPTTVKESLVHLYELIGESRLAAYINEWSKWCLLSLALFHIGFVTRQELEDESTQLAQTLGDTQWEEAENCLRNLIQGNLPADNNLIPILIPQLANIYTLGALTEESHGILLQMLQTYLSPEAVQNVPGRVSALTHYTVPRTTSMEDHMAQMGFIYLAFNVSLTCAAPTLIFENQRNEAHDINISLSRYYENSEPQFLAQNKDWAKYFSLKKVRKMALPKIQDSLQSLLVQEIEHYIANAVTLIAKLKVCEDTDSLYEFLEEFIPDLLQITLESNKVESIENKLRKFSVTGRYLLELMKRSGPVKSIRLGLLQEPAAIWGALTRNLWGEVHGAGLETVVVTKALWANLRPKRDSGAKTLGEDDDETTTLVLEKLALCGASWDSKEELVTAEELAAATLFFTVLDLCITHYTVRVKKIFKKSSRAYRAPVYIGSGMDAPLFWLYLPLGPKITTHSCVLRGVKLVIS